MHSQLLCTRHWQSKCAVRSWSCHGHDGYDWRSCIHHRHGASFFEDGARYSNACCCSEAKYCSMHESRVHFRQCWRSTSRLDRENTRRLKTRTCVRDDNKCILTGSGPRGTWIVIEIEPRAYISFAFGAASDVSVSYPSSWLQIHSQTCIKP